MENALVVGSSGGIGSALVTELASRSVAVTGVSRRGDGLDITQEASIEAHLGRIEPEFDLIAIATGVLAGTGMAPEKAIREVTEEAMSQQFLVNAIGPMLVLKHCLRLLPKHRRSVVAVISARVGSIGDNKIGGWHSYRSSKAALNQLIHGASVEMRRTHKHAIVACLHPGTVATPFTEKYAQRYSTVQPEVAAAELLDVVENLTVDQTGDFLDYAGRVIPW